MSSDDEDDLYAGRWAPHESPYAVFWCGGWRPVTWMGIGPYSTDDPTRATAAVLWLGSDWASTEVHPGEVVRNPEPHSEFLTIDQDGDLTPIEDALG